MEIEVVDSVGDDATLDSLESPNCECANKTYPRPPPSIIATSVGTGKSDGNVVRTKSSQSAHPPPRYTS